MNKTLTVSIIGYIIIILFALFSQNYLKKSSESLVKDVEALKFVSAVDKNELISKVKDPFIEEWNRTRVAWSMLIDHNEIDNIEDVLKRVEVLLTSGEEKAELFAELNRLKFYLEHIPEKEGFALKNIL